MHTLWVAGSGLRKGKNMSTLWVAGSGLGRGKNMHTLRGVLEADSGGEERAYIAGRWK